MNKRMLAQRGSCPHLGMVSRTIKFSGELIEVVVVSVKGSQITLGAEVQPEVLVLREKSPEDAEGGQNETPACVVLRWRLLPMGWRVLNAPAKHSRCFMPALCNCDVGQSARWMITRPPGTAEPCLA
jgi:sRNA-binding carbon storage regulator CsrA